MNPLRLIRTVPQPLKTLSVLWIVAVLSTAGLVLARVQSPLLGLPIGGVAVLMGLTMATDYKGGATAMAAHYRTVRPLGIDYSGSMFAKTWSARVFGVMAVVVGIGFLVGVLSPS